MTMPFYKSRYSPRSPNPQAVAQLACDIAQVGGIQLMHHHAGVIADMCAQAGVMHRVGLDECNGFRGDDGHTRGATETEREHIEHGVTCAKMHLAKSVEYLWPNQRVVIETHRDARGAPVRLELPNGREIYIMGDTH